MAAASAADRSLRSAWPDPTASPATATIAAPTSVASEQLGTTSRLPMTSASSCMNMAERVAPPTTVSCASGALAASIASTIVRLPNAIPSAHSNIHKAW